MVAILLAGCSQPHSPTAAAPASATPAAVASASATPTAPSGPVIPFGKKDLYQALERAPELELLSIDPAYGPGTPVIEPQFMGFNVLGVAVLKGPEKAALIESFKKGIDTKSDTMEAACFDPHHGLRCRVDGRQVQAIICYHCLQVYAEIAGNKSELKLLTTAEPDDAFRAAVKAHHLPVKEF